MNNDVVGFSITTEILLDENKSSVVEAGKLLIDIEEEINNAIESKFKAKVTCIEGKSIRAQTTPF